MFILLSFGIILFTIICLLNFRAGALLVILFLPLYLIRFNIFGASANALDMMIFILFLVWAGGGITNYELRITKGERTMSNIKNQISNQCQKGEMSNKKTEQQSVISASLSVIPAKAGIQSSDSQMFGNSVIENSLEIRNWKLEIVLPICLILAGSFISMSLNDNKLKSLGIIKSWFIAPIIFFAILLSSFNTEKQRELVLSVLAVSGAGVAALSLVYKFLGIVTYDGRLQGIFNSPNYLAMYLAPCLLICGYKLIFLPLWKRGIKGDFINFRILYWFLAFILSLLAFFFTFSYSAWISLFVSGLVFFGLYIKIISNIKYKISKTQSKIQKYESHCEVHTCHSEFISGSPIGLSLRGGYSRRGNLEMLKRVQHDIQQSRLRMPLILFFIFLFSGFLILFTQLKSAKMADLAHSKRYSIESRLIIWRSSFYILKENPFWGIGLGNFQEEYLALSGSFEKPYLQWAVPHPHNIFLAFWLNCGLLGLIGFIWLLFIAIKKGLALMRTNPSDCHSCGQPSVKSYGVGRGRNLVYILLITILIYILLHGLVDTTYFKNDLAIMFWVAIAFLSICEK